ncbi:MAG: hypothetical protein SWH78_16075 [Thermodesulfobacteriota bacterium]|nr:hypothetical protein [Thermodesulfobacteriota bacterium]
MSTGYTGQATVTNPAIEPTIIAMKGRRDTIIQKMASGTISWEYFALGVNVL